MASQIGNYDIGDLIRMRATFVSTDLSTPADPSTMIFRLIYPDNSVSTYKFGTASVTRAGVGAYYTDVTASVYGPHAYSALATGGVQTVEEWQFNVRHSKFVI